MDLSNPLHTKRGLQNLAQGEAVDFLPPIPDQTAQIKAQISLISKRLKEMEEDAHTKYFVQRLSEQHLAAMECYHEGILSTHAVLKRAFSSIHKVPAECWVMIFRYQVEGDYEECVKEPGDISILSTAVILSQVCSFWRQVAHAERDLWKYFICGPDHAKISHQIERWKHYASFEPQSLVFLTNFHARPKSPVTNDRIETARVAMSSTTHSLHVFAGTSQAASITPNSLPFNGQLSVTVQVDETVTKEFINALPTHFPAVTSMNLRLKSRLLQLTPSIYRKRPFLERLVMDLTEFEAFRIDYYCDEDRLRELQVIHDGKTALRGDTRSFPRLEVLGITPPDIEWLKDYKLPVLKRLVLHGPKSHAITVPSLAKLSQHADFYQIKELELHNWPLYKPADAPSWSITPLVLAIAEKLRQVETIRFVESFIEGDSLVTLVKLLMDTNVNQSPSSLKNIIIDCCSGITRRDCEAIASSVEKLVVYV